ncbi:MAG TPA: septal ring lytic transglycosylase RlpA family protein [Ferruginibacter sp.]|nr:septal ring lytic transglycosylase RlpA family protein [Ferruginibacter sp.]
MKALFIINNRLLRTGVFVLLLLGAYPLFSVAQKTNPASQAVPKKTSRVFYGQASFYANKFQGRKTASGELFDQKKLTCACNVLPLGTWVKVTNLRNGRSVVVKINDRIHPRMRRVVDLSKAAAVKLGYVSRGLTRVKVEVVNKNEAP